MASRHTGVLRVIALAALGSACVEVEEVPRGGAAGESAGVVHVVLFTHVEDSTPGGALGSSQNRESYFRLRGRLIEVAATARAHDLTWVLQPDWKLLEAALLYEDATTIETTDGKTLFTYLRDDLGVVIDPHSHESGGYNYTDVAHLLDLLGVGGSTIIGGHVWDPALPEFQHWDRFREPQPGSQYPEALWRGDVLIGAGTPGHVNDPLVSGVWRPRSADDYFTDDPEGNIVSVGSWINEVAGVEELIGLYRDGTVPADAMLTASWNIRPTTIMSPDGIAAVENDVFGPITALCDQGLAVSTDFTTLVATWQEDYGGEPFLYRP